MKPILFNTEMVKALVAGIKTATRRLVKGQHPDWVLKGLEEAPAITRISSSGIEYPVTIPGLHATFWQDGNPEFPVIKAPYEPGDILYVRETWYKDVNRFMYRACYSDDERFYRNGKEVKIRWFPSIHMPKEAARIFLRVTDVKVEKLQNISQLEAHLEGQPACSGDLMMCGGPSNCGSCISGYENSIRWFARVWDTTIKPADQTRCGWNTNPWVWAISFERISREEALQ